MRFLDIAVAATIGLSCIVLLVTLNPTVSDQTARRSLEEAHLRDYMTGRLESYGLVSLQETSPQNLCEGLLELSNATISLSAKGDTFSCPNQPPARLPVVNMNISLGARVVTFEAWYTAKA